MLAALRPRSACLYFRGEPGLHAKTFAEAKALALCENETDTNSFLLRERKRLRL